MLALPSNPVARKINCEIAVVLGWGRAILLQLAHPLVAAGIADHSDFRSSVVDYVARARRTVGAMLALTFGTENEARAVAAYINAVHDRVRGRLTEDAGVFSAGTPYAAGDPELLRWVHATLLDSLPLAYETFVGPLTVDEEDRYCAEASDMAPLLRLPKGWLPRSRAELDAYLWEMYASGQIHVSETARTVAHTLLSPPLGPARPLFSVARLTTVGLLPPPIREAYGFAWDARHEASLRRWARGIRQVRSLLPPLLREWPQARRTDRHHARPRVTAAARKG